MKVFQHSASSRLFSWTLILTLTTASFLQFIQSQPQKYFRGNSVSEIFERNSKNKITPFPSKALPRIGRRSGVGSSSLVEPEDENYGVIVKEEEGGMDEPIRGPGLVKLNADSRFNTNSPTLAPTKQNFLLLLKYLLKYGVIRPEDYPVFFRFNEKSSG